MNSKSIPPSYIEFIKRLGELGYVEGDTLIVEYINLEGHLDRYGEAMRELVRRRVDLIFALGQEDNLRAAMAATSTIPIVMLAIGYDPMAKGYVKSLAQPGGNVTGIYVLSLEAVSKRLQLFKDAFPQQSKAFGFWDFDGADTGAPRPRLPRRSASRCLVLSSRPRPMTTRVNLRKSHRNLAGPCSCPAQRFSPATPNALQPLPCVIK